LNLLLRIEQDIVFLVITVFFHLSLALVTQILVVKNGLIDRAFGRWSKYQTD